MSKQQRSSEVVASNSSTHIAAVDSMTGSMCLGQGITHTLPVLCTLISKTATYIAKGQYWGHGLRRLDFLL